VKVVREIQRVRVTRETRSPTKNTVTARGECQSLGKDPSKNLPVLVLPEAVVLARVVHRAPHLLLPDRHAVTIPLAVLLLLLLRFKHHLQMWFRPDL
jgi:hypothetical protein